MERRLPLIKKLKMVLHLLLNHAKMLTMEQRQIGDK